MLYPNPMQEIFLRILDRIRFALILATVFLVPFFLGGERPLSLFVMRGLIAAAGVLALAPLLFGRGRFETEPRATLLPLGIFLVFLAYVFFQSVAGHAVFAAGNGFGTAVVHQTREQAAQLVFYTLFFFLCLDSFHSKRRVRFLTFLVAAQVILLIAVGYAQRMQSLPLILGHFDPANMPFFSTFLNENHYGAYLLVAGFLFLGASAYGYESAGARHRSDAFLLENIFLLVVITLGAASSFYAEARAAFLAQAVVIPLFFLAAVGGRNRGRAFFVLAILGALVFVFIQMFFPQIRQSYGAVPAAFNDRWSLVKDGWEIFRDYPLFGAGLGSYPWVARAYQGLGGGSFYREHLACEVLELLMDTGVVGTVLCAAPFLILIPSAFLRSRRSPSRWCRTMGLALFFAVIGVFAMSLLE
ncbi:MAG: O-antigen ligase family protein [Candidatus Omnitrophica bacterium]|nr:O-antigen ligase family protein [Candidatus Omnitrophota bacterium]